MTSSTSTDKTVNMSDKISVKDGQLVAGNNVLSLSVVADILNNISPVLYSWMVTTVQLKNIESLDQKGLSAKEAVYLLSLSSLSETNKKLVDEIRRTPIAAFMDNIPEENEIFEWQESNIEMATTKIGLNEEGTVYAYAISRDKELVVAGSMTTDIKPTNTDEFRATLVNYVLNKDDSYINFTNDSLEEALPELSDYVPPKNTPFNR